MSRLVPVRALPAVVDECCSDRLFPVSLRRAVADARRRHRPLIAGAGRWALARGVPLPADHIALWAANAEGRVTGPWRASMIPEFLDTVAAWCTLAACAPPADFTGSLWHLYGYLAAADRLHPASDALTELRAALVVFGTPNRLLPIPPPPPAPRAA